jgi:hypothetical protein
LIASTAPSDRTKRASSTRLNPSLTPGLAAVHGDHDQPAEPVDADQGPRVAFDAPPVDERRVVRVHDAVRRRVHVDPAVADQPRAAVDHIVLLGQPDRSARGVAHLLGQVELGTGGCVRDEPTRRRADALSPTPPTVFTGCSPKLPADVRGGVSLDCSDVRRVGLAEPAGL